MKLLKFILINSCFAALPLSAMDESKDMPSNKPLTFETCNTNFLKYNEKLVANKSEISNETLIGITLACTNVMKNLDKNKWDKGYKRTKDRRKEIYTEYKKNSPQNTLKQLGLIDEELSDSEKNENPYTNFQKLINSKQFSKKYTQELEKQTISLKEKITKLQEQINNEEKSAQDLTKKRKVIEQQKDIENNQKILESKVQEILDLKNEKTSLETDLKDIELFKNLIEQNISTQNEQAEKQLQDTNNKITELSTTIQTKSIKLGETNTSLLSTEDTSVLEQLKQQKNLLTQEIKDAENKIQELKNLLQQMTTKKEYMEKGTSRTLHTLSYYLSSLWPWATAEENKEKKSSSTDDK
jgi:chromosome segregation ATPase